MLSKTELLHRTKSGDSLGDKKVKRPGFHQAGFAKEDSVAGERLNKIKIESPTLHMLLRKIKQSICRMTVSHLARTRSWVFSDFDGTLTASKAFGRDGPALVNPEYRIYLL
jgi:hypothetical protein